MNKLPSAILITFTSLLLACACSRSSSSPREWTTAVPPSPAPPPSPLPSMVQEADGESPPAPDLCTWAGSVDEIVWGTLVDVRLVDAPAITVADPARPWEWKWADRCDPARIRPALELHVRVARSLRGAVPAGSPVAVRVGLEQAELFRPAPVRGPGGNLQWVGPAGVGGQPLAAGQMIGMGLHRVPTHNLWSLMGEAMFSLGAGGAVAFQERGGEAVEPAPAGVSGLSPDQLIQRLASCQPTAQAASRRSWVRNVWGAGADGTAPPTRYLAAFCARTADNGPATGSCGSDTDCEQGQVCAQGQCR